MRVHAFELHEHPRCPAVVREGIIEILGTGLRLGRIYDGAGAVFAGFCDRAGCERVLDLCSGSGDAMAVLLEAVRRRGLALPRVTLSDLYPDVANLERVAARFDGAVAVCREPVDAAAVPGSLGCDAVTIISAFHHFRPALAERILADAVHKRRAVFILEPFPRSLRGFLSTLPAMTLGALAAPLRAPRRRGLKLLLSLAPPLIPLVGVWDYIVSVLRVHSEAELLAMARRTAGAGGYVWRAVAAPFRPGGRALAFYGWPGEPAHRG